MPSTISAKSVTEIERTPGVFEKVVEIEVKEGEKSLFRYYSYPKSHTKKKINDDLVSINLRKVFNL